MDATYNVNRTRPPRPDPSLLSSLTKNRMIYNEQPDSTEIWLLISFIDVRTYYQGSLGPFKGEVNK